MSASEKREDTKIANMMTRPRKTRVKTQPDGTQQWDVVLNVQEHLFEPAQRLLEIGVDVGLHRYSEVFLPGSECWLSFRLEFDRANCLFQNPAVVVFGCGSDEVADLRGFDLVPGSYDLGSVEGQSIRLHVTAGFCSHLCDQEQAQQRIRDKIQAQLDQDKDTLEQMFRAGKKRPSLTAKDPEERRLARSVRMFTMPANRPSHGRARGDPPPRNTDFRSLIEAASEK